VLSCDLVLDRVNKLEPREREIELLVRRGVQRKVAEKMAIESAVANDTLKEIKEERAKINIANERERRTCSVEHYNSVAHIVDPEIFYEEAVLVDWKIYTPTWCADCDPTVR